jgi:hypothetical protein
MNGVKHPQTRFVLLNNGPVNKRVPIYRDELVFRTFGSCQLMFGTFLPGVQ